jgi:hypothetical protein
VIPDRVRLPLSFDVAGLLTDVLALSADEWVPHFNNAIYEGDWSGVALRAAPGTGPGTELYPDPTVSIGDFIETPALTRSPHLRAALAQLRCPVGSARLLMLGPGATIRAHSDYRLGHEDGEVRLHMPIVTDPRVEFFLSGQPVHMAPGECWYLNLNCEHRAANPTADRRIHLVVDCTVDSWLQNSLEMGAVAMAPLGLGSPG